MKDRHWTEQDFIDDAYGIGPQDGHADACGECRSRREQVRMIRREIVHEPETPHELLAAQRRAIYRRLDQPRPGTARRAAPALAAVFMLLIGLFLMRQTPPPPAPPATAMSDSQLFAEIYAVEQSSEPRAASPIRALFEEN
jgi:hypothetical protein